MTDSEILKGIKKFIDIRELVGRGMFKKYGSKGWKSLDFRLLWAHSSHFLTTLQYKQNA